MATKKSNEKGTIIKTIRFSPNEYQAIQEKMKEINMKNFGRYARLKMMLDGKLILQDVKDKGEKGSLTVNQMKIIHEVNKIGNNLNQITKAMNEQLKIGGKVSENDLSDHIHSFTKHLIDIKIRLLYNKKDFDDTQDHLS